MDWGLAKVLKEGGVADEPPAPDYPRVRGERDPDGAERLGRGRVAGRQRAGDRRRTWRPSRPAATSSSVDRRADVFGLGSILCEVLTGQPAYTGRTPGRGDSARRCGATPPRPRRGWTAAGPTPTSSPWPGTAWRPRPRTGRATRGWSPGGSRPTWPACRSGCGTAERQRAVAEARAVEERRRRKLQVGLAAAVLALTTLGGLSTTYYLQQRQARAAAVERVLGEAITLRDQASDHPDDPARWQVALAAIRRVEDVLGTAADSRAAGPPARVATRGAGRQRRRPSGTGCYSIAWWTSAAPRPTTPDGSVTDAAYADAFREAGLDLAVLPPAEAGARIKARPPAMALARGGGAGRLGGGAAGRSRGTRPGRNGCPRRPGRRTPTPGAATSVPRSIKPDKPNRLAALQAAGPDGEARRTLGAVSLDLLGKSLDGAGDSGRPRPCSARPSGAIPATSGSTMTWAECARNGPGVTTPSAIYTAARSIRPETAHELAHVLEAKGEWDEAIAVFQEPGRRERGKMVATWYAWGGR